MPKFEDHENNNTLYGQHVADKFDIISGEKIQHNNIIDKNKINNYISDMNERIAKLEIQSEQYKNDISEIKKEISHLKYWMIGTAISIISILFTVTSMQINNLEKNTAIQLDGFKENTDIRLQYLNEKYDRLEKQIDKNHQEILSKIEEITNSKSPQ